MGTSNLFATQLAVPAASGASELEGACNALGHQLIAQALPPAAVSNALGALCVAKNTTGIDSVAALPTTNAGLLFYNNEIAGTGKSYVIESVHLLCGVVDAAAGDYHGIIFQLNAPGQTAAVPTDATNVKRGCHCQAYGGRAVMALNQAQVNTGWFPLGTAFATSNTVAGCIWQTIDIDVRGRIVIPPQGSLGLQQLSLAAVVAQSFFTVMWHEVYLPCV